MEGKVLGRCIDFGLGNHIKVWLGGSPDLDMTIDKRLFHLLLASMFITSLTNVQDTMGPYHH